MCKIGLLLFFFFSINIFSQNNVFLKGTVKNQSGKILELANIVFLDKETMKVEAYSTTNDQGYFTVSLVQNKVYILKINYIGFKEYQEEITLTDSIQKNIVLEEDSQFLKEVVIVKKMPIKISGDTISYNVSSFSDGKEKKLGDIFKKLPGFEVDASGEVKVMGKKIDKIMVDGKEFFTGDTKIATNNIPASAVEKVNLLKNLNQIAPLNGVNDEDNLVLDIKLKEGEKNIAFGSNEIGGGHNERYLLHSNLFYYAPKISLNFIGDINNIGNQVFTFKDYLRFNGGFNGLNQKSGTTLSANSIGLSMVNKYQVQSNQSQLGAFNFTYSHSKKLTFSGFAILSHFKTNVFNDLFKTYLNQNGSNEIVTSNLAQKSPSGIYKLQAKYTPNEKSYFEYNSFIKSSQLNDSNIQLSIFDDSENKINVQQRFKSFSLQQSLEVYHQFDDKNVISFSSSHQYKNNNNLFDLITNQIPFNSIIPVVPTTDDYNLIQNKKIGTNSLEANFNYYHVINDKSQINFGLGGLINNQDFTSGMTQKTNNGEIIFSDGSLLNDTEYRFSDYICGVNYKIKWKKLLIDTGVNLHLYKLITFKNPSDNDFNKSLLLPNLKLKYSIKKARIATFNYSIQTEFDDIEKYAQGKVILNYNTIFSGNQNLKNAWYHIFDFDYYDFNIYNHSYTYVVFNYQKKYMQIADSLIFQNANTQYTSLINSANPSDIITGFINYDRRFKKFKGMISTNLIYNTYRNAIANSEILNTSFIQKYNASLTLTVKKWPFIEIGFEKTINTYNSSVVNKLTYFNNKPYINIEVSFLKDFIFKTEYEYTDYGNKDGSVSSNYDFLNATLYYRKQDSKWEFKMMGTNIMNTKSINNDSYNNLFVSTGRFLTQPRYFTLSTIYHL